MPFNEFHYTPTGTGVISGKEVLEQTEDAINDLGTQISGDVQTAIDTANNALNTANTASADAQNAVNTANTAYTTATNAQNTANTAQNTASNALTAAQNAQNDVNALGNRVTTAENNISQNTTDISGLTTRMGTAEGNITTLQNDVVTAQGTATSAQNTATMAREQAYVLRYASSAVTPNSTVAYSVLNNTDNVKVGDSLIDTSGQVFLIVSVDNVNETVTVGAVLLTLALDANVMHLTGNETATGEKTFSNIAYFSGQNTRFIRSNNDGVVVFGNGLFEKGQASNINLGREYHGTSTSIVDSISYIGTSITDNGNNSQVTLFAINNTADSTSRTEVNIKYDKSDLRPRKIELGGDVYPTSDASYNCGLPNKKYLSFNGINPGALSLPDLSAGLDISGYITTGSSTNDTYTALSDGYISIILSSSTSCGCYVYNYTDGVFQRSNSITDSTYSNVCGVFVPILKNQTLNIASRATENIVSAKFFPCLGNV